MPTWQERSPACCWRSTTLNCYTCWSLMSPCAQRYLGFTIFITLKFSIFKVHFCPLFRWKKLLPCYKPIRQRKMPLRKQVTWRLQLLLPHPEEESLGYVGMLISLLCQAFHTWGTYLMFCEVNYDVSSQKTRQEPSQDSKIPDSYAKTEKKRCNANLKLYLK